MEININGLVPIEKALNETKLVFNTVDYMGKVVILKDNKPVYILIKYDENVETENRDAVVAYNYTLHEAMKIVLSEVDSRTLHASELANIIYERKLYVQKNGDKAQYNQIRARCGHYPDMFEALPKNYIKLIKD